MTKYVDSDVDSIVEWLLKRCGGGDLRTLCDWRSAKHRTLPILFPDLLYRQGNGLCTRIFFIHSGNMEVKTMCAARLVLC